MSSINGNAFALTVLSPIKNGRIGEVAYADEVRDRLQEWNARENSPMAKVPRTYLCRYYVLDDVYTESQGGTDFFGTAIDFLSIFSDKARRLGLPHEDHLKSRYLVFSCNLHGDLHTYLRGMWAAMEDDIRSIWEFCYGFDKEQVKDADGFIAYIEKCRLDASLFFVGSTDDPLEEQLKALYLKQEFTRFALEHQGRPAAELKAAYQKFIQRVQPRDLAQPSWAAGQYRL